MILACFIQMVNKQVRPVDRRLDLTQRSRVELLVDLTSVNIPEAGAAQCPSCAQPYQFLEVVAQIVSQRAATIPAFGWLLRVESRTVANFSPIVS